MALKTILNPDGETAARVLKALRENGGYCPCKPVKSKNTVCRCKEFRDCDAPGPCHCGLYIKVEEE